LTGTFFHRLAQFYSQGWAGPNPAGPSETKRGLPPAVDSPPFPFSDWGYGGAPDIGAPDGNTYPLMSALNLENSRTKAYGWLAGSFNFSTSAKNTFPVSYDIFPNKIELNQAVVCIERLPDTVQASHFDWGYHVTGFYGIDYRFTTAKGYFSEQLLQSNKQYGFDPVLEYFDLYFPVKDGLNIRIGRFLSVPGIEAQLAPNNYNMTHSLLYTIDPFTDTGAIASLKLNKQWMVQFGSSCSHDVACWTDDARASGIFCLNYSTASNNDNFYGVRTASVTASMPTTTCKTMTSPSTTSSTANGTWRLRPGTCMSAMCRTSPEMLPSRSNLSLAQTARSAPPDNYAALLPSTRSLTTQIAKSPPSLCLDSDPTCLTIRKGSVPGSPGNIRKTRFTSPDTSAARSCSGRISVLITRGIGRDTTTERPGISYFSAWT